LLADQAVLIQSPYLEAASSACSAGS